MNQHDKEQLIQKYLDGELDEQARQDFRQQLKADTELRNLFNDYSVLRQELSSFDSVTMPKHLWKNRIRPALEKEAGVSKQSFWSKLSGLFNVNPAVLRPVGVGFIFIIFIVAATLVLQNQFFMQEQEPYQQSFSRIEALRKEFLAELHTLSGEMDSRKERLVPEVRAAYEEGLEAINKAIESAERYYTMNADEQEAITRLMAAYDRKTVYLKRFLSLDLYETGEE